MKALDAACSVPWAIRPESLDQILQFAQRAHEPDFIAAAERLAARANEIDPHVITVHSGQPLSATHATVMRDAVAVVPIEGPIFRYANLFSSLSGATSLESLAGDLQTAIASPDVKAILLHIDSPGGEVNGIAEFANAIYQARGSKPITAYISNEGCSAAYWIASAADKIVVSPTAIVGNIGVIAAAPDPRAGDRRDQGSVVQIVSSQSPNKRPDPNTSSGHAKMQSLVDSLAEQFIETVARNRNTTPDQVVKNGDAGWVFVGQKAIDAGLADELGDFESLVAALNTQETKALPESKTAKPAEKPVVKNTSKSRTGADMDAAPEVTAQEADVTATADSDPHQTTRSTPGRKPMGLRERLLAALQAAPEEDDDEPAAETVAVTTVTKPEATAARSGVEDAEVRQLREELLRERQTSERIRTERIQERAESFAAELRLAGHIVPAEEAGIVSLYVQAATDDWKIADGGDRVGKLKAAYQARPPHMLTMEAIPQAVTQFVTLANQEKTPKATEEGKPMSEERRRALLEKSAAGRAELAARNGNGIVTGRK